MSAYGATSSFDGIFTQDMQETALFLQKITKLAEFYTTAGRDKISTLVVIVKNVLKLS